MWKKGGEKKEITFFFALPFAVPLRSCRKCNAHKNNNKVLFVVVVVYLLRAMGCVHQPLIFSFSLSPSLYSL